MHPGTANRITPSASQEHLQQAASPLPQLATGTIRPITCVFADHELEAAFRTNTFSTTSALTLALLLAAVAVLMANALLAFSGDPAQGFTINGGMFLLPIPGSLFMMRLWLSRVPDQRWAAEFFASADTAISILACFSMILLQKFRPDESLLGMAVLAVPLLYSIIPHACGFTPWHQALRLIGYTASLLSRIGQLWGAPDWGPVT